MHVIWHILLPTLCQAVGNTVQIFDMTDNAVYETINKDVASVWKNGEGESLGLEKPNFW
jgi:ABC-type microcin C transport system permease subunit YejB